jgi:hypothetical protein
MRRTLILVIALVGVLAALPTGAGAKYTLGVSDQQSSTFTNPLFAPLKFKAARYITPWDVLSSRGDRAKLDAWLAGARAAHQRILISFEHSHRGARAKKLPSVKAFTAMLRKFKARYPFVNEISPWNEVNRQIHPIGHGQYQGQPTWRNPKRVAQYYMAARKVYPRATIVGIDLLDQLNVGPTITYLRKFLRFAHPDPKVIGLHNYSDTNRFSTLRTRAVLRTFRGKVWLTETGGIVKLGRSFRPSTSRAAKALGCMFSLAKTNRRIQRLYVYQFNAPTHPRTASFDAGLINPNNTRRAGYKVVQKRQARRCHA